MVLPYVIFHPVEQEGKESQIFLEFLIDQMSNQLYNETKKLLLFLCVDHNSVVRVGSEIKLMSDVAICLIIKKLYSLELNTKSALLILWLCQLDKFCSYSSVRPGENMLSIKEKVEDTLVKSEGRDASTVDIKIVCTVILSLLYRHEVYRNLSCIACYDMKRTNHFKLMSISCYPFDGIIRKEESKRKKRFSRINPGLFNELDAFKKHAMEVLEKKYKEETMVPLDALKLEEFCVNEDILKQIG
jgi:hypothetical protein